MYYLLMLIGVAIGAFLVAFFFGARECGHSRITRTKHEVDPGWEGVVSVPDTIRCSDCGEDMECKKQR